MSGDPVFHSLLVTTFAVSRERKTSNGQGGWVIDYVPNGEILGRLRPASGAEALAASQTGFTLTHILYTDFGVDVQRGDRVDGGGVLVYVEGVRDPSQIHEHLEIDCYSLQDAAETEDGS